MAKNKPLSGRRVLVTRAAHQIEPLARALIEAGAEVLAAPLIAFEPPDDDAALQRALNEAAAYAWIVFTSANGVAAFPRPVQTGAARFAAIGSATAQALAARGMRAELVPDVFIAESLAQQLVDASRPDDRILIVQAQRAREVLPALLRRSGRHADVAAAYKTVTLQDPQLASKVAQCDIITFTSASTVQSFSENLPDAAEASRGKLVACIGPVTAQAARARGLHVDAVAETFSANGLRDALVNLAL